MLFLLGKFSMRVTCALKRSDVHSNVIRFTCRWLVRVDNGIVCGVPSRDDHQQQGVTRKSLIASSTQANHYAQAKLEPCGWVMLKLNSDLIIQLHTTHM